MPPRRPAVSDEVLRREAGMLADDVLLMPSQVILLVGLSVDQLKERQRRKPPQPPHPEPREKPKQSVWYSLGEVRRFRAARAEKAALDAEVNAEMARRGKNPGFASWLNTANAQSEPWPCAIVAPHGKPVDAWATIRGEVAMGRGDSIRWLSLDEYLDARQAAALAEARAADQAEAVGESAKRQARGRIQALINPSNRVRVKT
jgi:hypothetical protein